MNDRELLTLAARAAGFEDEYSEWSDKIEDYDSPHHGEPALHKAGKHYQCHSWNPLIDDGDALRLALKLGIQIGDPHQYSDLALACTNGRLPWAEYWEPIKDGDYCAATRRAIVRAAAKLARAMP